MIRGIMMMRALHWDGAALHLRGSHPVPRPAPGMALVRVTLAGICSTDLQIFRGYMGFRGVPGHEFVGRVEEGPPGLSGRRVVGEINFACGSCDACARGLGRHCPTRRTMGIAGADGAFADFVAVPIANLHPVPDHLPDEAAVFCEPLAAACEILDQTPVSPQTEAVVLGDGKLGLLAAQVLHLAGASVLVIGRHSSKLALARRLGIGAALASEWAGRPVDLVVEATGSMDGLRAALAAVRPRGVLVLKSTIAAEHALSLAPLVINEVTVIGSRCGPFQPALAALGRGDIAVAPLVERVYPLGDAIAAVEAATRPGSLKILLDCSR